MHNDDHESKRHQPAKAKLSKRLKRLYVKSSFWPPLAAFAGLFIVWELATKLFAINPITLPSASAIAIEFFSIIFVLFIACLGYVL